MPIAGRPRNPEHVKDFVRFHRAANPVQARNLNFEGRTTAQAPGTIRRLWRNQALLFGGSPAFSWSANRFSVDPPGDDSLFATPLRYLITTLNILRAGNQLSRPMRRTILPPSVRHTGSRLVMAGNVQNRPVLRARVPSYGARVPALNAGAPYTEGSP